MVSQLPPRSANRRAFHHRQAKYSVPAATPAMKYKAQAQPIESHAFCIQRQADQQPSTAPSISNGAVQNSPELNVRSSQRPSEHADQHGRDDDPAQYADLAETACHRRFALALAAADAFVAQPDAFDQRVLFVRGSSAPGQGACTGWPAQAEP